MSQLTNSIKGSLNVITGCGSGLGRATMRWFLKQGSGPLLAIDRKFEENFDRELDLTDEQRSRLMIRKHDTFDENVESSLQEFVTKHGPIQNLINVAGVALSFTFITDHKDQAKVKVYDMRHARDLVRFNTVGTFNMIRLVSRYMVSESASMEQHQRRSKCIVNTSCISTTKPSTGQTFYAGTNAAVDSMTLCLARELSPHNIRCNTINVGYFDTRLLRSSEEKVATYIENEVTVCPKRLGHPDEFAHLAQAIVENQMINGACIRIDAATEAAQDRPAGRAAT